MKGPSEESSALAGLKTVELTVDRRFVHERCRRFMSLGVRPDLAAAEL